MIAIGRRAALLGLPAAFAGGRLALAAGPAGDARLAVIVLRGAVDGLDAVPPYGDPGLAALRGEAAVPEPGQENGALDLGGRFGLHPTLGGLHGRFAAGEALVFHAVAGPWRSRSHFEAQEFLENGATRAPDGWLSRALAGLPQDRPMRVAASFGTGTPLLLRGPAPSGAYLTNTPLRAEAATLDTLRRWHASDPVWGPAMREALASRRFAAAALGEAPLPNAGGFAGMAGAAGRLLAHAEGPRVAVLELGGWDTHSAQATRMPVALRQLDVGLEALRAGLGAAWNRTAVLALTEFGRTARLNGAAGTDHGTGTVAFLVGGAVAGGRVLADWPGLAEGRLFENRDLLATLDLRRVVKGVLADHLRLPPAALDAAFPGSRDATPLAGLIR